MEFDCPFRKGAVPLPPPFSGGGPFPAPRVDRAAREIAGAKARIPQFEINEERK